jgi:heme-degrading monooxygenase HmoA
MLIRMSQWRSKPDADERSLDRWSNGVKDLWLAQDGLLQVHLLARPGSLQRMTFSVWESQDAYQAFARSGALGEITSTFEDIYDGAGGLPQPVEWVVLTQDWPRSS